jgi:hypothetical protein
MHARACASRRMQSDQRGSRTVTTKVPLTEGPISEGSHWVNGKAVGLDWSDVQTDSGFAYGRESGNNSYDDSTSLLTGTWDRDQWAQATVHFTNQQVPPVYEEVEPRLRSAIAPHAHIG